MNINRNNYEEYFLLYTDNELSAAEKHAVEEFIRQNPDLQKEFTMLQQSTFSADDTIIFRNKEVLMQRSVNEAFINNENYEEMFILYSDEELTADQKTAVEKFVYHHPQYQEEFELIQSVKLIPDLGLTYPDKHKLYAQRPQVAKRMVFTWTRVAVAAAVLIFAGVLWLAKPGSDVPKEIVKSDIKPALRIQTESPEAEIHPRIPAEPAKIPLTVPPVITEKQVMATNRQIPVSRKNLASGSVPRTPVRGNIQKDQTVISGSSTTTMAQNSAPAPDPDRAENGKTVQPAITEGTIAVRPAHPKASESTEPAQPAIIHSLVQTEAGDEPSHLVLASNDDADALTIAGFQVDKRGSIRGIFRKASRFIDKTTSIRPAKKQGLVIGNIEIAFQ